MLGLFGTLSLGSRSLLTQQKAIEVAGHNLANVNNPAYARQRLVINTGATLSTSVGPQGTGADGAAIIRLRSDILDKQITAEFSVRGSLEAQERALEDAQAHIGQMIDRRASGPEGSAAAQGVGGQHALGEGLTELFNAFQSLSTNPTSTAERQVLLMKASDLATKFNATDSRLATLQTAIDDHVRSDVDRANEFITDLARLNDQITRAEVGGYSEANDLRDLRQQKIEELSKIMKIEVTTGTYGALDIAVDGVSFVTASNVVETFEAYDAGGGQILVRAASSATPLAITGGSIHGLIDARDSVIGGLRTRLDSLASTLIAEVNTVHTAGYSITGTTGASFFSGTGAANIAVNPALLNNPSLVQASATAGNVGDNTTVLALAALARKPHPGLGNQTFNENYGQTVASLGQSLSSVKVQLSDQKIVEDMLTRQRDSTSGVSLDEEMTDLTRFQKAFAASARLIATIDEMLNEIVNLKR